MQTILAKNVGHALITGLNAVATEGLRRDSRNGPVYVFETPVTTIYERPTERVLFYPERDANPFFHFMEGLWMIAGRNDVEWISRFNASIANYSDDGITFHGAYGYRWRQHFGFDQLDRIVELLRANPDDRRIVLQMWDPSADLGKDGKDFPCNTGAKFRIVDGRLDMTVENRSNDMIWGAYGANAVHFSMLQEYMAARIGAEVGYYFQISTNFHAYVETLDKHKSLLGVDPLNQDRYYMEGIEPFPMVQDPSQWEADLGLFMDEGDNAIGYTEPFFRRVASPMMTAWKAFKRKDYDAAMNICKNDIAATDWSLVCFEWIERRAKK